MKRTVFALMITLVVFLTGPVQKMRAASCSNATLYNNGTFGWAEQAVYPYPGTVVGYITFQSSGSFQGVTYGGTNGGGTTYDISGTYSVNSNCTLTLDFASGINAQGVVVSSGKEVFLNQTSPTGYNLIIDLKAVTATSCSNSTLYSVGTYGWVEQAVYPIGTDVGFITFTSSGVFAGIIYGGENGVGQTMDISGTYTVQSNCTLTLDFASGINTQGIIVSSGNEVFLNQTSPTGTNLIIDLKKE